MITKTLTSLIVDNSNVDLFYRINDTFISNSAIHFSCPLNVINTLLSESISSGSISSYKLYVRIVDSVSGVNINAILFEKLFNLNTSNIENNSIIVNISELTNLISHDYLCENMTSDEIFNLYKNYKIIFRLSSSDNISDNKNTISANDIIQDLNLVLNTAESGPYNVKIKELDFLDPNRFSSYDEYRQTYIENIAFLGKERLRIFYPENFTGQMPLYFHSHGMGQFTSSYDLYLASIASYGYVCVSITTVPSGGVEGDSGIIIPLINYFKNNANLIDNIFTKINYNKIILSGHSRGGASVFSSYSFLKNKNYISNYSNLSLTVDDVKLLVGFADAFVGAVYKNFYGSPVKISGNFSEDSIKYYDHFLDKPIFYIKGTEDLDSTESSVLSYRGLCGEIKRNLHDIINISVDNFSHGEIALSPYSTDSMQSSTIVTGRPTFGLNEETVVYNTNTTKLNEIKSELIYFLSIIICNSTKIKKLYYQDINLLDKKILKTKRSGIKRIIFENYSNIKYGIDYYENLFSSYAGITGVTFTSIAGFTYDFCISANNISNSGNITFDNAINMKKIPAYTTYNNGMYKQGDYSTNNNFNGIIDLHNKGLYLPIESNFYLGYTFTSGLTLLDNEYLCLRGALKRFYVNSSGNTLDCSFKMTLIDQSNNYSTLSSDTTNQKFYKPYNPYLIGASASHDGYQGIPQPTFPNNIYFRAGDFYLQNPSLDLNNINQIMLSFGPDHGSTFCHIVLDEFIVLKEV